MMIRRFARDAYHQTQRILHYLRVKLDNAWSAVKDATHAKMMVKEIQNAMHAWMNSTWARANIASNVWRGALNAKTRMRHLDSKFARNVKLKVIWVSPTKDAGHAERLALNAPVIQMEMHNVKPASKTITWENRQRHVPYIRYQDAYQPLPIHSMIYKPYVQSVRMGSF